MSWFGNSEVSDPHCIIALASYSVKENLTLSQKVYILLSAIAQSTAKEIFHNAHPHSPNPNIYNNKMNAEDISRESDLCTPLHKGPSDETLLHFLDVAVEASKVSMQHEHITDSCEPKDIPPQGGLYRVAPRLADVPEFLGARFRRSKKWDTTLEVKNGTRHAIIESVGDFISMRAKASCNWLESRGKTKEHTTPRDNPRAGGWDHKIAHACEVCHVQT